MGCDIHLMVEHKINGTWQRVPDSLAPKHPYSTIDETEWDTGRNYWLFGILAGVRAYNFEPFIEPRGIPDDVSDEVQALWERWDGDGHTPHYLTLPELIAHKDKGQTMTGFLDIEDYMLLKERGYPEEWMWEEADIPAHNMPVKIVSNQEMDRLISLMAFWDGTPYFSEAIWTHPYRAVCPHFWDVLVPAMSELDSDPNNVRIVFWFDN